MRALAPLCRLFRLALLVMSALALVGCATGPLPELDWRDPAVDQVWPSPPETARLRYLRSLTGVGDFEGDSKGSRLFRWVTGEKKQGMPLVSPFAVAADGNGRVWVTDPGTGLINSFDLGRRRVEYWGQAGDQPFVSPAGIGFDPQQGTLYVSDPGLNKVFALDLDGELRGAFEPPGGFGRPAGLAVDASGSVYVADVLKGVVHVFNGRGEHQGALGSLLAATGRFNRPTGVALGRDGSVFVLDTMNFKVEVQNPDGTLVGGIGGSGDVPGALARPRGVAVDSEGHLYVSDAAFDNLQIFSREGQLLLFVGGNGDAPGFFNLPAGMFIDRQDHLYVVDSLNRRVQIFQYLAER
ncbi:SMP-30/gluconolactonase/LRE family protein [Desulfuromonas versatilis]|nr:SMP-30/gluconolactonase/LRE family protein [Desulfuromonas versatilis]